MKSLKCTWGGVRKEPAEGHPPSRHHCPGRPVGRWRALCVFDHLFFSFGMRMSFQFQWQREWYTFKQHCWSCAHFPGHRGTGIQHPPLQGFWDRSLPLTSDNQFSHLGTRAVCRALWQLPNPLPWLHDLWQTYIMLGKKCVLLSGAVAWTLGEGFITVWFHCPYLLATMQSASPGWTVSSSW